MSDLAALRNVETNAPYGSLWGASCCIGAMVRRFVRSTVDLPTRAESDFSEALGKADDIADLEKIEKRSRKGGNRASR